MPLTLRPTGLQFPAYADRQGWTVFEHGCVIGRIYEDSSKSTPAGLRWFWSITRYVPPRLNVRTNDKVGSLMEAKEQFRRAWEAVGEQAAWADGYSATEYAGLIEVSIPRQRPEALVMGPLEAAVGVADAAPNSLGHLKVAISATCSTDRGGGPLLPVS